MEFADLLKEIKELREKKNQDYNNSFINHYNKFGLLAVLSDIGRKTVRLEAFAQQKEIKVKEETLEDTLKDLAVIALNAIIWIRQKRD